jgi:hypothetical protein
MTRTRKIAVVLGGIAIATLLSASSCDSAAEDKAKEQREAKSASIILCGEPNDSLECKNLKERERRNSQPNAIGYVYLYNFDGSVKGYFTIKGKVSSTQSQMGPMDTYITHSYGNLSLEAAGDDGSYGPNETGIFFFTTEGVMVTYSGEYVLSDGPLKLSTNKLN